jgi:hypothetical protein
MRLVDEQDRRRVVVDVAQRTSEIINAVTGPQRPLIRELIAQSDQPEGPSALRQPHRLIFEHR